MKALVAFLFSFLIPTIVSCYGSSGNSYNYDARDGFDDQIDTRDVVPEDILSEESLIDDTDGNDVDEESTSPDCTFNSSPINIDLEGVSCELLEDLQDDQWIESVLEGQIMEIHEGVVVILDLEGEEKRLTYTGLTESDIEHNLRINSPVEIRIILLKQSNRCVKGVVLKLACGLSMDNVMMLRDGDLNNPLYPKIENQPFLSPLMPFEISTVENDCIIDENAIPGCTIGDVYDMKFLNAADEFVVLAQGESELHGNGQGVGETIYRVINNYIYYSEDCGGNNMGYFIQMFDPPYYCGI